VAEKRKHHRAAIDFPVTCVVAEAAAFPGVAKDISVGGMFVESESSPEFGSAVAISIDGISTRTVKIPAVVRWNKSDGFGVQFGLLGAYETYVITELLKKSRS
jgi:type IV pilus assembly protein PilZ